MEPDFKPLVTFLAQVPAIKPRIATGVSPDGLWWVKFRIDTSHRLAWHAVQELAHVLNYLSIRHPLPTIFRPVSPPPYLNGGPARFLSWMIESRAATFSPADCATWLHGRLPRPVFDLTKWDTEAFDDGDDDERERYRVADETGMTAPPVASASTRVDTAPGVTTSSVTGRVTGGTTRGATGAWTSAAASSDAPTMPWSGDGEIQCGVEVEEAAAGGAGGDAGPDADADADRDRLGSCGPADGDGDADPDNSNSGTDSGSSGSDSGSSSSCDSGSSDSGGGDGD